MINQGANSDGSISKQQAFRNMKKMGKKPRKFQRNNAKESPRIKIVNIKIENCSAEYTK